VTAVVLAWQQQILFSLPCCPYFTGSRVVERLLAAGHNVQVLARPRTKPDREDMLLYLKVCFSRHATCCWPQQLQSTTSAIFY
jgi:hypothetical protein